MEASTAPHAKPIPICVGLAQPEPDDPNAPPRNPLFKRRRERSPLRDPDFDWARHNLEPRWLTMESSDCAAALEPSIFTNHGGAELNRFLAGAASRDEIALVIATIGDVEDDQPRFPDHAAGDSVLLPGVQEQVVGVRLPTRSSASLAPDVNGADRDLGLRLLNSHPPDAPWWGLSLHGLVLQSAGGPAVHHEPNGQLDAILVDGLGHPVVAAWTPQSGEQRWYVIPDGCDWHTVLDWLRQQALPEYVPNALRRARAPLAQDQALQTPAETSAQEALDDLDTRYEEEHGRIESELREATADAEPIRNGLLYGTGTELERAVATTLTAAGFAVTELDEYLGDTASADLLVAYGPDRRLVEVKSASGNARESLVGDLERHLQTWPQLRPDEPVAGGVLIVNQQHRREPADRTPAVYARQEFIAALTVPVLSTLQLFDWWRNSDWAAIRSALSLPASDEPGTEAPHHTTTADPTAAPDVEPAPRTRDRGWRDRLRPRGSAE
jgi:hypothetical protein